MNLIESIIKQIEKLRGDVERIKVREEAVDNSTPVTLAGTPDYITLSGQQITRNQIVLTTDVSGTLPIGNGGSGATTAAGARAAFDVPGLSVANTLTGDLTLDDGTGDSPAIHLVGGSNDDTVTILLEDDAVAGDSDLVVKLADAAGDSKFVVRDSADADVAAITSNKYLGVGHSAPLRPLHVVGPDGAVPTFPSSLGGKDLMVFENNDNANFGFVAGTTKASAIKFYENAVATFAGAIEYSHNTKRFNFTVETIRVMTLNEGGLNLNGLDATTAIQISNDAADGDAVLIFALSGTPVVTMGVDDGDGDKFKIGGAAIGTDTALTIDPATKAVELTGDLTLDDGTGDSPAIHFVGGSNDDTATLFLEDDAAAGKSDLVVKLADAAGDSQLIVRDSADADVVIVDSNGNVGIGTLVPNGQLEVASNSATKLISYEAGNTTSGADIQMRKSRGTVTSPLTVQANDFAGGLAFYAYDGSAWDFAASFTGQITAISGGNVSGAIQIYTSNAGSITKKAEFPAAGGLEIEDSEAVTALQISNAAADGDPVIKFALSGTPKVTMGVEDGAGDVFKVGSTAIATNTVLTLDPANDKMSVFDETPVVQQPHIIDADGTLADLTTKFNTLLAQLENFGINASS